MKVGIDLGTTYSAVATFDKASGSVHVLNNSEGQNCTPSVVCIDGKDIYIGNEAKGMMSSGNENAAAFYKSFMGDKNYRMYLDGNYYTPEDLSSMYLRLLVRDIEEANGAKIDGAVITVPAYFNEKQRQATMNAGRKAGLNVLKIINEPTAAIIAYGLTGGADKTVLVYDLGGGTFDVTIARIHGSEVDVLTTNGNHMLGGKDWDGVIFKEVSERFLEEFEININDYAEDRNTLQVRCEEAKKKLSSMEAVTVTVSCNGYTGRYEVTRAFFEEQTEYLLNQTFMLLEQCFEDVKKTTGSPFGWRNIDEVVLVGGSTRMLQVRERIIREYGKPPVTKNVNVDTIVASGAALQAELCVSKTLSLGGGAQSAGSQNRVMTLSGADIHDITSHSLGMLALNRDESDYVNSIILKKNSRTGTIESKNYSFGGNVMDIYVLQGESTDPLDCTILYRYSVSGMRERQKSDISVAFQYNLNGIVEVTATSNGVPLRVVKTEVDEGIDELLMRLRREREEAKNRVEPVSVEIFVDVSGSMEDDIETAKDAVREFIRTCGLGNTAVALYVFSDKIAQLCDFTDKEKALMRATDSIAVDGKYGYCNEACPLGKRGNDFGRRKGVKAIVVLTDGIWEYPGLEIKAATDLKREGIIIYAVGVGSADRAFLERIASEGGAKKIDFSELNKTFKDIAGSIATEN